MTREVSRENSQDAQDKDPRAVRPDKQTNGALTNAQRQARHRSLTAIRLTALEQEVARLKAFLVID